MKKTILITGSTDGIGELTARKLVKSGYNVIIHGRNAQKVQKLKEELGVSGFVADLSSITSGVEFAKQVSKEVGKIDVLINNAGVFKVDNPVVGGFDVRIVVNTITPYLLTNELKKAGAFNENARVINLSSAAQATVDLSAVSGQKPFANDSEAYAQSKLALTMWTNYLAPSYKKDNIMMCSVNPKSFLGSKMVKSAYGMSGVDLNIGADILIKASLSDEFANVHGQYFDNDYEMFAQPHPDALDEKRCEQLVFAIDKVIEG